jgi:uncharacterized membrane protein
MGTTPATKQRKLWLDWQRGLAVLFMVEWHTWDSWRLDSVASGPIHEALNLIGGFAAPSFLYMAGMSQLLGDAAQERKGVPVGERRWGAVRRALWLLGVAYAFRVVEFLLGGAYKVPNGWEGILKVDVLNVIAISLLVAALVSVGLKPRAHVVVAVGAAAAVALLAPPVAGWLRSLPPDRQSRLLDYLYSEWPRGIFYLFPWAAFAFAGSALGRLALKEQKPLVWTGIGLALIAGGFAADRLPAFYAHQDFWRVSPSWFAIRLGGVVVMSGILQALPLTADRWISWLRTLGRHSMLGYFVSIEIPYGVASGAIHKRLGTGAALFGVVAMIVVTWGFAVAADRYDAWKAERAKRAMLPEAA